MAKNPNQNVWSYVPPHRGATLDGGSPQAMANDNSVSGGWSDRSHIGSSTSGFEYVEEAKYDGNSYVRRDGKWVSVFEGDDSYAQLEKDLVALTERVKELERKVTNLSIEAEGWDEERIETLEDTVSGMKAGTVTFDKIMSAGAITAYTSEEESSG